MNVSTSGRSTEWHGMATAEAKRSYRGLQWKESKNCMDGGMEVVEGAWMDGLMDGLRGG